ncbi:DUF885 domain-containing protein [Arenicella sp. 4NH20-0111]|uniref:DUF885 domain-containing protein n=1 Tax=Arenicella sp. 4NH20-0111 TaxID=3127648 RepID=UPI00310607C3
MSKKVLYLMTLYLLVISPCEAAISKQGLSATDESKLLNQWLDQQYQYELVMSPMTATREGFKEGYSRLDDFSELAERSKLAWKKASVEEMRRRFDYEKLNQDAKLSYRLWEFQHEELKSKHEFQRHYYVFNQLFGPHTRIPTFMINYHSVETVEEMQDYISRLAQIGRAINQLTARMKAAGENGIRPPRFVYEQVRDQASKVIAGRPFDESERDSSLYKDMKNKTALLVKNQHLTKEDAMNLIDQAERIMSLQIQPAYVNLIDWLETDMANSDKTPRGVSVFNRGREFYNQTLISQTTSTLTADEIHDIGLEEVARIRVEMLKIKGELGYQGSLIEFFAHLRDNKDNPDYYFSNNDEGRKAYIDQSTSFIRKIESQLPRYFNQLPKADLVVKRVEPYREEDGAPQHYLPPQPNTDKPGVYYAHLSDMSAMPKGLMEVTAYHEALPGHHMQVAIAQELDDIPTFRKRAFFGAYIEGWALYSEVLAKEMEGTYQNLLSDFGRLSSEMIRAIRLVVDTGLHSKGWSRDKATEYFSSNSLLPAQTIQSEINRYLVWPGQATSYKVGMLHIQDLRRRAESELGDQFDLKEFHGAILDGGALPLSLLEDKVGRWINQTKKSR